MIADTARLDGVKVIGVDEHVWRHTRKGDAFLLRHRASGSPDAAEGWWTMKDLVAELARVQPWADVRQIRDMLASPAEPRFEVDGDRVRARYGHSVDMPAPVPTDHVPSVLYHGRDDDGGVLPPGLTPITAGANLLPSK